MERALLVYTTFPDAGTALDVGEELVRLRLAACVNVVPGLASFYRWKGQVEKDAEMLLVIKTRRDRVDALKAALVALHPYDVPELVVLSIESGHAPYLSWLDECVTP